MSEDIISFKNSLIRCLEFYTTLDNGQQQRIYLADSLENIATSLQGIEKTLAKIVEEGIPLQRVAASTADKIPEEENILAAYPMRVLAVLYKASPAATVALAGEPVEIRDLAKSVGRPVPEVSISISGLVVCGFAEMIDDGRVRITPIGRKAHELGLGYLFPNKTQK